MALSPAQRQARHRKKLRVQEVIVTRLPIPGKLHDTLKKRAKRAGTGFHAYLIKKLKA